MSLTPKKGVDKDQSHPDGNTGIRQVEDREATDLEEIENIPIVQPIDQVPNCPAKNECQSGIEKLPTQISLQKDDKETHSHDRRDNDKQGPTPRKDPERTTDVVYPRQSKHRAKERPGLGEDEGTRSPPFGKTVKAYDESSSKEIREPTHCTTAYP